jgi:hypothetical protein
MATVNFSVPEDVKRRFNRAFAGANKSAVVAQLMQRAVEGLLRARRRMEPVRQAAVRAARVKGRP